MRSRLVDVEQEAWEASAVDDLMTTLRQALETQARTKRALRLLEQATGSCSARAGHHAPKLAELNDRIRALTEEMRTVRLWSLEMAHFIEHWHPVGPSFPAHGGGRS